MAELIVIDPNDDFFWCNKCGFMHEAELIKEHSVQGFHCIECGHHMVISNRNHTFDIVQPNGQTIKVWKFNEQFHRLIKNSITNSITMFSTRSFNSLKEIKKQIMFEYARDFRYDLFYNKNESIPLINKLQSGEVEVFILPESLKTYKEEFKVNGNCAMSGILWNNVMYIAHEHFYCVEHIRETYKIKHSTLYRVLQHYQMVVDIDSKKVQQVYV